jgi:hypothetical protein
MHGQKESLLTKDWMFVFGPNPFSPSLLLNSKCIQYKEGGFIACSLIRETTKPAKDLAIGTLCACSWIKKNNTQAQHYMERICIWQQLNSSRFLQNYKIDRKATILGFEKARRSQENMTKLV